MILKAMGVKKTSFSPHFKYLHWTFAQGRRERCAKVRCIKNQSLKVILKVIKTAFSMLFLNKSRLGRNLCTIVRRTPGARYHSGGEIKRMILKAMGVKKTSFSPHFKYLHWTFAQGRRERCAKVRCIKNQSLKVILKVTKIAFSMLFLNKSRLGRNFCTIVRGLMRCVRGARYPFHPDYLTGSLGLTKVH